MSGRLKDKVAIVVGAGSTAGEQLKRSIPPYTLDTSKTKTIRVAGLAAVRPRRKDLE